MDAVDSADLESAQRELISLRDKCKAVLDGSALSSGRRTLMTNRVAALQTAVQLVQQAQARQDDSQIEESALVSTRDYVVRRYLDYLDACNRQAWGDLAGFLAETVLVNGRARTRSEYVADVVATTNSFPDYRWELRHAVWDGVWLAVHLHDSGTRMNAFRGAPGDGTRVETAELDMYRIADGLIHEVEGTADNARLCD